MSLMNKVSTANRRGFLKKSLYSAPVVLALGHLTPSMVYGADGSGGFTTQQPLSAQEPVSSQAIRFRVQGAGVEAVIPALRRYRQFNKQRRRQ